MSTLTVTIASDNLGFFNAVKSTDPESTLKLGQVEDICATYSINDEQLWSMKPVDYKTLNLTAEATFRANAASFDAQMKTTVGSLIHRLNRPNIDLTDSELREYVNKAVETTAYYAQIVEGDTDRWLTITFNEKGELIDAVSDNGRTLMPGQKNSTLVNRPDEEKVIEELHATLTSETYGWELISGTHKDIASFVNMLRDHIDYWCNEYRKGRHVGDSPNAAPILAITMSAYAALREAGCDWFDEDNYGLTFTFLDLPYCAIYVTDREAFWDKSVHANQLQAEAELSKQYQDFTIVDDGRSELVPVFIPGKHFRIFEITDWEYVPPTPTAYVMDPADMLEEPPF